MQGEHEIVRQVSEAKRDMQKADALIRQYVPFIRAEVSRCTGRLCTGQEDEYSIGMIAFHEAIQGYETGRGAFLPYAALLIRSRVADYQRREARHQGHISLHAQPGEEGHALLDTLADRRDPIHEADGLAATRREIQELAAVMAGFGVTFSDVTAHSPRQQRTLQACVRAVRCGAQDQQLLAQLLQTKKLPLARLAQQSGVERKTLERHRKYVLAMLLIQTNGYEMVRNHLRHVWQGKGGAAQ